MRPNYEGGGEYIDALEIPIYKYNPELINMLNAQANIPAITITTCMRFALLKVLKCTMCVNISEYVYNSYLNAIVYNVQYI